MCCRTSCVRSGPSCCSTICNSAHTFLLSFAVSLSSKPAEKGKARRWELSCPPHPRPQVILEMHCVSCCAALVHSRILKVALDPRCSLWGLSFAVSPVVAVREAPGQFQRSGGGAVPSHPWWGSLHGRQPWAMQDLRCGGELWEPDGLQVWQSHRLQWFHH